MISLRGSQEQRFRDHAMALFDDPLVRFIDIFNPLLVGIALG
jgi:hypothetical protein